MTDDKSISMREELGSKLRELREGERLTLQQVAELSGVDYSHISKIERGVYAGSIDTLSKIASAMGARVEIVAD